jgi:hypothetical protein
VACTRSTVLIVVVAPTLALAACGGGSSIAKRDVEKQASAAIAKLVSDPVTVTTCPDNLEATVGKSEICRMAFKSGRIVEVKATVTSVKGDSAAFDVRVTKVVKP